MKPTLDSNGVWTGTKMSEKKSYKHIKEWVQSKIRRQLRMELLKDNKEE
ncbi:MAG: hypothetical protein CM15mV59_1230 [Caudoviricetes sp.]|nr:MAG: hypothetical protein CM15mV59_1230 [Caudoviricetes sp.]